MKLQLSDISAATSHPPRLPPTDRQIKVMNSISYLNSLLSPSLQCISEKLTADQFAESFRTKIDSIRTATASAEPPVIVTRQVPPLSCFKPATIPEILHLLKKAP